MTTRGIAQKTKVLQLAVSKKKKKNVASLGGYYFISTSHVETFFVEYRHGNRQLLGAM